MPLYSSHILLCFQYNFRTKTNRFFFETCHWIGDHYVIAMTFLQLITPSFISLFRQKFGCHGNILKPLTFQYNVRHKPGNAVISGMYFFPKSAPSGDKIILHLTLTDPLTLFSFLSFFWFTSGRLHLSHSVYLFLWLGCINSYWCLIFLSIRKDLKISK